MAAETAPGVYEKLTAAFKDKLLDHAPLKDYTSTQLGGVTDYLVKVETCDELILAVKIASEYKIPYLILGGGSGVIVGDSGWPGLTIINAVETFSILPELSQVIVSSGMRNGHLVNLAANNGLGADEFLAGIPGTIGGAVATGATYNNKTIYSILKEVVLFLPNQTENPVVTVPVKDIEAESLTSRFDFSQNFPPVILSIKLQLARLAEDEILKRISAVRADRPPKDCRLGWCFTTDCREALKRNNYRFPNTNGVHLDRRNANLVVGSGKKVTSSTYRQVLEDVRNFTLEEADPLVFRTRFVGYWPDGEKNG